MIKFSIYSNKKNNFLVIGTNLQNRLIEPLLSNHMKSHRYGIVELTESNLLLFMLIIENHLTKSKESRM